MRSLFLIAIAAAAVSASAQTATLVCTMDGKPAGSAQFSIVPGPNRTYVQTTVFKILQNGQQRTLTSVVKVNFDGYTMEDEEKDVLDGKLQKDVSVHFTTRAAVVTTKPDGKTETIAIPAGANVKDIGGLWFLSITPRPGDKSSATTFATDSNTWKKTTRTYVGDKKVVIKGKQMTGHEIQDSDDNQSVTSLLDDHGLPIEVDIATYHFVRQ